MVAEQYVQQLYVGCPLFFCASRPSKKRRTFFPLKETPILVFLNNFTLFLRHKQFKYNLFFFLKICNIYLREESTKMNFNYIKNMLNIVV